MKILKGKCKNWRYTHRRAYLQYQSPRAISLPTPCARLQTLLHITDTEWPQQRSKWPTVSWCVTGILLVDHPLPSSLSSSSVRKHCFCELCSNRTLRPTEVMAADSASQLKGIKKEFLHRTMALEVVWGRVISVSHITLTDCDWLWFMTCRVSQLKFRCGSVSLYLNNSVYTYARPHTSSCTTFFYIFFPSSNDYVVFFLARKKKRMCCGDKRQQPRW